MARDKIIQFNNKESKSKHSPSKGYALYNEGICLYNQDKDDLAMQKFLEAEKLGFESDDLYARIADLVNYINQEKAVEYISKAIELEDQNSYYHFFKGQVFLELGRYKEALPCLLKAEELEHDSPYIYTGISICYEQIGDRLKALAYASKAIKKYPNEAECYRRKAWVYYGWNKNEEALKYFLEAEKLGADTDYYQISVLYNEFGNSKLALAYINKFIIADRNNFYGYYQKGLVLYYMDDKYDEALENFLKADSLVGDSKSIIYDMYPRISWIYDSIKDDEENARKYAQIAIDLAPNYEFSQYRMGCIYSYREKDYKTATKYFKKAYNLSRLNGDVDCDTYVDLGRNYYMSKKYSLALKYVEEGLKLYPQNLSLCSVKLAVLYKQRKYNEGKTILEEFLKTYPENAWCLQGYALILYKFKQYAEAIKYFEVVRDDLSNVNACSLFPLAYCYFKNGSNEKCIVTFLEYSQKEDFRDLEKQDIRSIKSLIKKLSKIYPNDDRLNQIKENFKSFLTL